MPEVGQGYKIDFNEWYISYVLNPQSVWQFHCAYIFNLLQFFIADLNMFILFRFIRDEPGLIRDNNITGATVDMPAVLAHFGHYFDKITLIHCTVRSQFCRRRCIWLRIIRKCGFKKIRIFVYDRMICVNMPSIIITARAFLLLFLLPVMIVRFRIRDRFLFLFLFFRARILTV
jgi:hypothetical protein